MPNKIFPRSQLQQTTSGSATRATRATTTKTATTDFAKGNQITSTFRFLTSSRWPLLAISLALFTAIPSLWAGYMADDHYLVARFLAPGFIPDMHDFSLFGLFSIAEGTPGNLSKLVNEGLMPWFTGADFRFKLSRPIAEFSHYLDFLLWPHSPFLMHLHHLVWLTAFFGATLLLYKKLFSENTLLFSLAFGWLVLDSNMSQTIIWLAARNTLMAATFSVLSIYLLVKWQTEQKNRFYLLSIFSFALGIFSSEYALGCTAYLFAYVLWMMRGGIKRFLYLLPFAAIAMIWALAYLKGKQGVIGSGYYVDPVSNPGGYLLTSLNRYPAYLFHQLFLIPLPSFKYIQGFNFFWMLEVAVVVAFFWAVKSAFQQNLFRFLVTGALLSLLPICASPGGPRILLLASVGLTPLIAYLIHACLDQRFSSRLKKIAHGLIYAHAFSMLFWVPAFAIAMSHLDKNNVQIPAKQLPVSIADTDKQWIMLNSAATFWANEFPLIRAAEGDKAPAAWYLSGAEGALIEVVKETDHSIQISSDEAFMKNPISYFVRKKSDAFVPNKVIEFNGMKVTVLELTADGRPRRVRFEFDRELDDKNTVFLGCEAQLWKRIKPSELQQKMNLRCNG